MMTTFPLSEKEKMLAGMPYNPRDDELMRMYKRTRQLLSHYNTHYHETEEERRAILAELLGHVGRNVWVEPPFFCDYGEFISLGDNTFINFNCVFLDCAHITIGRNVLIAPAVQIYAVTHPVAVQERLVAPLARESAHGPDQGGELYKDVSAPVSVGDDCWIGGGSIVLPGVRIGNGVTIGAGSVVTKDIPDNVLAYGNPCRVVRGL